MLKYVFQLNESESKIDLAIKYFSTASGLAVIMSDWEKANELMENLINIYSPKLTQDEVHMLKSHMLSGKNKNRGAFFSIIQLYSQCDNLMIFDQPIFMAQYIIYSIINVTISEMKLGEGLRQREQEQNEAEIDEITPSVLKQIENMPKDRRSLEYFF